MRPALSVAFVLCSAFITRAQESAPAASRPLPPAGKDWDVTASYTPVRAFTAEVHAGTWMNLDVDPTGKEIVFDLLGDLYTLPIEGGRATRITSGPAFDTQPRYARDGKLIAFMSDRAGGDNLWVMNRDGTGARQVTKEAFRLVSTPVFTPDGQFLVGRKHFTSRRSLGAGEMWMYHLSGGEGQRLTNKPNEQQNSGEPEISPDGRFLYYSEDVSPGGAFDYNRDPNDLIYAIFRVDLASGEKVRLVDAPGGAVRPKVSPDGKTLAFVRRIRAQSCLMLRDLATGDERVLYRGLSKDQQETWCIFGVYPNYAWMPDGAALVIWAHGRLWSVRATDGVATEIPFHADVDLKLAETVRFKPDAFGDTFAVREVRWPAVAPDGKRVAFQALGALYLRDLPLAEGAASRAAPALLRAAPAVQPPEGAALEFMPAWSPDGTQVASVTWDDQRGGAVVVGPPGGSARTITTEPGHYANPSFSPDGREVVFERMTGDGFRGRRFSEHPGVYRVPIDAAAGPAAEPTLVCKAGRDPHYSGDGKRILLHDREGDQAALVSVNLTGGDRRVVATSERATAFRVSPDGRWLAFTELFQAYVCPLPASGRSIAVSPGMSHLPCVKVSRDAGEFLSWSPDSHTLYSHNGSVLSACEVTTRFPESRPAADAAAVAAGASHPVGDLGFDAAIDRPSGTTILAGARIVTMRGDEVIEDGVIVVTNNRITAIGRRADVAIPSPLPAGTRLIDVTGRTIVPGFVDEHSHMFSSSGGLMPRASWPHLANLAFGVTTTHDPSNDTKQVFAASELQRVGGIVAPRLFSTGTILYGAEGDFKAVVDSLDDARSHLRRLAAHGAWSVKSYNQPRRDQRQQVLQAARELHMNVVPEGGSLLVHNLTQIIDGHTTIEHALPVAPLEEDVFAVFAASGTAYNPTLIVGYGGIFGENYWYQKTAVWQHERLLKFVPRETVDRRARRPVQSPDDEINHIELAKAATELARRGVPVCIGSHGQLQGLGAHWEMWMLAQGGSTPLEALRAASLSGARALGLDGHIGSLEAGKLADLVVMGKNPLENIRNTDSVVLVMQNGRLYDADTLDEVGVAARKRVAGPPLQFCGMTGAEASGPDGE